MSELKAIGFDLDGTLFDHRGSAGSAVDRFIHQLGLDPSPHACTVWFAAEAAQFERWRSGQVSFQEQRRERLRTVLPVLGVDPPTADSELDELFELYLNAYRDEWRAFPESLELLMTLRASGYGIGLLSNGSQEQQLDKLRRTGLGRAFDVVCISEGIGVQKPDAQAFRLLAERLRVDPTECLFVGDDPVQDTAGAHASGMRSLLVSRDGDHLGGIAEAVYAQLAVDSTIAR
ncbi:HAD family hydrolase [Nesterenkonia sp. E16_7]|uniref:HAD family hydrolase n=1 Tax=unclassified Nesterenkonia TaxID=2629769 RepID=UPI001A928299|nr:MULTISPECIES: HAD family hydrolase [unclassified Nesterenkonia]MBO0594434.1 HAD family hydrolase [Nesterenkonia sp. E16_10]MBO0598856.1 HAD family hydrolase [Nesterenkonia sp. E16_7]